jgi:multidrug efflux pump subunit AcrB
MSVVNTALRRPISVMVVILAVILGSVFAIFQMPRDIFPDLGIPVIYVSQPYGGMDPSQMEGFLVNYYEYHFLYIEGIESVESRSIQGAALIKLQFHPGMNMATAMAETIAEVSRSRAFMPPGTVPPFILRFDAGSIPIGNLVFSSPKRTLGELQDLALFRVRPLFATLPGVSAPPPFGASQRTIVINADPEKLRGYNMSPAELMQALVTTNTITPSGNITIGDKFPMVPINTVVKQIKELEEVPVRVGSLQTIYLRDVASVVDATDIPTSFAEVNGHRTIYIPVTKRADASTLAVANLVKAELPHLRQMVPEDISITYEFDQSYYVTNAIKGVLFESLLGAFLTGFTILLFLRDWRSALIIVLNIPIALMAANLALWIKGSTVNIMTLGGLALAVGILVDEGVVVIENVHRHLSEGKSIPRAALDATVETTGPRLLSMLSILAVFMPSFFMKGAIRELFVPLALAVGFSMIASYILSTTFVPIMSILLFKPKHSGNAGSLPADGRRNAGHPTGSFAKFQKRYANFLTWLMRFKWPVLCGYLLAAAVVIVLLGTHIGTEIFPYVDAGQFLLRIQAPAGSRIEKTEEITLAALEEIKKEVGPENVAISLAFVGVAPPSYAINLIYLWTSGPQEAILQVQLKHEAHIRVRPLQERLRARLAKILPDVKFSFEPSDIVSRVMSFGSPTPVQVAVSGPNIGVDHAFAEKIREALENIPSLRDLHYGLPLSYPAVKVDVDRERAGIMGITAKQIANSVVSATSSSRYVLPNFWADPTSGIAYQVQVEIPLKLMTSTDEVKNIPVAKIGGQQVLLRNVATVTTGDVRGEVDRFNMQRMVTLNANISGEDLGHVSRHILKAIGSLGPPPRGVAVDIRGQVKPMEEMLSGLERGFLLAIVVIFLLLAYNFQSFRLSLAVVSSVPAVASGVLIALWLSGTTLNLESFMGAIMAIGVSVANAILLVTFAERARLAGNDANAAAVEGAQSRLRPILMTSLAMMAGMIIMALGLGESGPQTAPLGRAVVGGLFFATVATLLILPSAYAIIQARRSTHAASLDPTDPSSARYEK